MSTGLRFRRPSAAALLGFAAVAAVRALTLPRSFWELDEFLFAGAVEHFDPLQHRPHPPGYPLLAGLGKLFALVFQDPFTSLVALAFVSSLVGYWALVAAGRRIWGRDEPGAERVAVVGALLFLLSPVMLVQAPLPMSDPPALMFLALALAAAGGLAAPLQGRTRTGMDEQGQGEDGVGVRSAVGLGAFASASIGCRPQLALCILPMLAVALVQIQGWKRRVLTLSAFTLVSLLWFAPLVMAVGGWKGFLAYQMKQASYVAQADAAAARAGGSWLDLAARFIAHPWGPSWLSLTVLALAVAGTVEIIRRHRTRAALPLAALTLSQLAACLALMDPADGVRYALPAVMGVALAAALGSEALARLVRAPAIAWLVPVVVATGGALYAGPLLAARSSIQSPPAQAAEWAHAHLPRRAGILVQDDLQAHASRLLKGFNVAPVEAGLARQARRPNAPLYLWVEGESAWPGAVTFRWPESAAYERLTRNHYRVVSLAPVPLSQRYQIVRGVYGWEPSLQDARWRWLDADAAIRLFHPGVQSRVALLLALAPASPLPANEVKIAVNGVPARTVRITRGSLQRVELDVPPGRLAVIELRSARSFVPAETGSGPDTRRLALQLLAVERLAR